MPLSALALVLLAGLLHAGWNIAAKKAGGDIRFAAFSGLLTIVVWAPVGLWFAWRELPHWNTSQWLLLIASAVLHTIYYLVLLRGYRAADLTVVYPLARGSGPLLSSAVAVLLLGEQLSLLGAVGIGGVVLGVFLIAGGQRLLRRAATGRMSSVEATRIRAGIGWGLLTGLFIASYTVVDGYGVKFLAMSPIVLDYLGSWLRTAITLPALLADRPAAAQLWRMQWKYAVVVAVASPIAYVLVLYAMQIAPLSHVAPAREVSMLFAALIGGRLLGEGDRLARLTGAALIAVGVLALGLG